MISQEITQVLFEDDLQKANIHLEAFLHRMRVSFHHSDPRLNQMLKPQYVNAKFKILANVKVLHIMFETSMDIREMRSDVQDFLEAPAASLRDWSDYSIALSLRGFNV